MSTADASVHLRRLLDQHPVSPALREAAASGALAALLPIAVPSHLLEVVDRLEITGGEAGPWWLKLAALVHHVPPADTYDVLGGVGFIGEVKRVADVLLGFGSLAMLDGTRDEQERFAAMHRPHLESLLLFAAAHEDAVTPQLRAIAALGGLAAHADEWAARLSAAG